METNLDFLRTNYEKLCIFCLGTTKLIEIYQNSRMDLNKDLSNYINKGYIKLPKDYGYPNYYCENCLHNLMTWDSFKESSKKSIEILNKIREQTIEQKLSRRKIEKVENTNHNCPYCGIVISGDYKSHLLLHENPEDCPFKCNQCPKIFKSKSAHKEHFNRDHLGIRFTCEICNLVLSTKVNLSKHKRVKHSNEMNYKCDQCDKSFKLAKYLYRHKQIHLKKFECDLCGKGCTTPFDLKEHIRTHTGERPLVCKYCSKTFRQGSCLLTHYKVHTGRKPYKCECGETFAYKPTFDNHKKTHLMATDNNIPVQQVIVEENINYPIMYH